MSELNREQIKKELGLFIEDNPIEMHFHHKKTSKFLSFLKLVLAVITTDEQKIFELENRLKECENGYEGTLYLDRCKLHDAEEKIKKLTEENERLSGAVKQYEEERKYHFEMSRTRIAEAKADTVREMQERIHARQVSYGNITFRVVPIDDIDQIAKEMLGGENERPNIH